MANTQSFRSAALNVIAGFMCAVPSLAFSASNDAGANPVPLALDPQALVTVNGAFVNGTSPTQLGRVFRDGAAPVLCPGNGNKAYPGLFNAGTTFNFSTTTLFNNTAAPVCATINFDPNAGANPCGTNAHISAYATSYDPNNQATNYLSDVGSSVTQPFSFTAPANSAVVLVVTNTSAQAECTFSFSYDDTELSAAAAAVPTLSGLNLALVAVFMAAIGTFVGLRRRTTV